MLSGNITTTVLSFGKSFAIFNAALKALPEDPPQSKPSSLINLLAVKKLSLSSVLIHLSTNFLSRTSGMKSYPIPST